MKKELRSHLIVGVISAFIAIIATASAGIVLVRDHMDLVAKAFPELQKSAQAEAQARSAPAAVILSEGESPVVSAVKKANPAVVAITISKNVPVYEQYMEQMPNPFQDFFGNGMGGFGGFSVPRMRQKGTELQEVGGGSGFLVSADGYIVTNRHVVSDEKAEYAVFMNDGKKYDAKVIARDSVLDVAVIKIDGNDFPHLSFADSNSLQVGQSVIAIGNALAEFRNTVSVGVVSGLSREINASSGMGQSEHLDDLIQTDAGINPGNSGGPLLNLQGEVVGVNVAMASGAENIGFALSSNSIKSIIESVKTTGKIVRPFIGVRYVPVTESLKEKNSLSVDYGVIVLRGESREDLAVMPGSPADKAGLVENDIILEIDGVKIDEEHDLSKIIQSKNVGDTVTLKVLSKSKEKEVKVVLEERK